MKLDVILYQDESGRQPLTAWFASLDTAVRLRIQKRLMRLADGNMGDVKSVGDGVFELRFFFGSGYRVYFGKQGSQIVILLNGGDKSTQAKDIKRAKEFWNDYKTTTKA